MLEKVLLEFFRVIVIWEDLKRLIHHFEALLELASLPQQQSCVIVRLEELVPAPNHEVGLRLIQVALSKLKCTQIVVALTVLWIMRHRNLESLIRQSNVSDANCHMSNVIPDISSIRVISHRQGPFKAVERHIPLTRVVTAEPNIIPNLRVVDARRQQSTIEPHRDLRLVSVEVIGCESCDSFNIARIKQQHLLAELIGLERIIEQIIDS